MSGSDATPSQDGRSHDATSEGTGHVSHARRSTGPVAVQMRESFKVGQDQTFLDECMDVGGRIADAIRAGTYRLDRETMPHRRGMFRSTDGARLPIISVISPVHDMRDAEERGDVEAMDLLKALDPQNMDSRCTSRHRLAVPAMVKAIADGRVLPPHLPKWNAIVQLPTPWSPATIESGAGREQWTDPVECGPEADVLPTECKLLTRREPTDGRIVKGRWIWTLTTQIVHFDAARLPNSIDTLRILADIDAREGNRP